MLFYTNNEEDINYIPSSYKVIYISKEQLLYSHPNIIRIIELIPLINEDKDSYIQRIESNSLYLFMLASLIYKTEQSASLVIVSDKYTKNKCGFNFCKLLCKMINKKYKYPYFKFTNDINRIMRDQSIFSPKGEERLIKDRIALHNEIVKIRK